MESTNNVANEMNVISEKSVELSVLPVIEEENTSLSEKEKSLVSIVYRHIKHDIETILINFDVSNYTKIIQMVALIMKSIESVTSQKEKIAGAIKKKVALECGRMCIKQMKDHMEILMIYDSIAESALETMVDVSRNLNVNVISDATSAVHCCMGFFSSK
jgi:hypothetical protein